MLCSVVLGITIQPYNLITWFNPCTQCTLIEGILLNFNIQVLPLVACFYSISYSEPQFNHKEKISFNPISVLNEIETIGNIKYFC